MSLPRRSAGPHPPLRLLLPALILTDVLMSVTGRGLKGGQRLLLYGGFLVIVLGGPPGMRTAAFTIFLFV